MATYDDKWFEVWYLEGVEYIPSHLLIVTPKPENRSRIIVIDPYLNDKIAYEGKEYEDVSNWLVAGAATLTLASLISFCSGLTKKPAQSQMVALGGMSLGGSVILAENLAQSLQVAFDSGAKRVLLPMASVADIPLIPGELFAKFQINFYSDPVDAVFKALGVE